MQIASAITTMSATPAIARDLQVHLQAGLPRAPDLLMVFISNPLAQGFLPIVRALREALAPAHLLAVIGESVLGVDREIERAPAVSALAIAAPAGALLHSFHLDDDQWQDVLTDEDFLAEQVAPRSEDQDVRAFLMFADPFTTPIVQLLDVCSQRFAGSPVLGGMASGMQSAGDTRLAIDDQIHSKGLVGVSFSGNIQIDCLVSQGCRPVGETFVVTKCHKNVVEQLDGRPALDAIEDMIQSLPLLDRQLLSSGGLQVGRVIDQGKGRYGRGDFLIRSIVGVNRDTGAVLIGDLVQGGQTLQFQVRDARTADEDLRLLLEGETMLAPSSAQPAGALLVTCNGRGTRLFEKPHHDIALTRQILGGIPVAGFFAAGELGPVGDRNFIHGHSAALALFRGLG